MKRFVILVGAIGVACAVWFGAWFYFADRLETEILALAEADGLTAPRVECDRLVVSGFPYRFAPRCEGATITSGDLTADLAMIQGTALFYRPTHIQVFADGPAVIADAFTGARQEVRWENFHASLRFSGGRIARVSALAEDLVYADTLLEETVIGTAGDAEFHLIDATGANDPEQNGAALDIFAQLDDLDVVDHDVTNGTATLDARLTGVPQIGAWGHPDMLRIWQMAGGDLEIRALDAVADGLNLSASGGLMLTETGHLSGRISVDAQGVIERLGDMADDPVAAMFIGKPDADGVYSQTLTLRSGQLTVGIIPVMTIPPMF